MMTLDRAAASDTALLAERAERLDTRGFLAAAIRDWFPGEIALVSSFGAEAAVLLHLVAEIEPRTPIILLDTGMLFAETLAYRDTLVARLGLRDVRSVAPDPAALAAADPANDLWRHDPDACCRLRKVEPLARALGPFRAWINGRKRFHGGARARLPLVERDGPRIKLTPLARWEEAAIRDYFTAHALPPHPLAAFGYASIGCAPCTTPVAANESPRDGRWRALPKTECGIHGQGRSVGAGGPRH